MNTNKTPQEDNLYYSLTKAEWLKKYPHLANVGNSAKSEPTPQWEIDWDERVKQRDSRMYSYYKSVFQDGFEGGYPIEWNEEEITFIKSTLEELIEKIHECCDGECYHDDCCGKLSCVKAQLRKEFL